MKKTLVPGALGEKIRSLRRSRGYTLERLGELVGSSKSYIWELENKNPPRPSAEKVSKIAQALGVTVDFLLDADQPELTTDALDEAFYRGYRQLNPETKEKFRQLLKMWSRNE